jgi:hypothetical protein
MTSASRSPLFVVVVGVIATALGGCAPESLMAWDVTLVPIVDCSTTGQANQSCVPDATLAQQRIQGRWTFEIGAQDAFSVITKKGDVYPGIYFANDLSTLEAVGCSGEGGTCYFARDRFESIDVNNNNCRRFGQTFLVSHVIDGQLQGQFHDVNGNDENCGNISVTEKIFRVTGALLEEPSLARDEATP